ncbi:MAG: hypothetical protein K9N35_01425 [Candidatus Marinimicrobia bacterium]|nr:hypothetical protein [Candidatus Neomarinimicrobiota bacterium]
MLSAGIISKVLGTKYPGSGTIYLNQQLKFIQPIYIGVKYICEVKVIRVDKN